MNWIMGYLVEAKNRYYGHPVYTPRDKCVLTRSVIEGVIRSADALYFDDPFGEVYRNYPLWETDPLYSNNLTFTDENCERLYRARMYCLLRYISACHSGLSHPECMSFLRPHLESLELEGVLKVNLVVSPVNNKLF